MRRTYRYSRAIIARAYGRSVIGLAVTLLPLIALEPASWLSAVLVLGAGLFLVYLARSIALHTTQLVLDEDGIRTEGLFGVRVLWGALRAVELNYYTTRNDRSEGWIELVVRGSPGAIRVESSLVGFAEIVACVAREALQRECPFDDRTRTHLKVLGIQVGPEHPHTVGSLPGAHHA